MKYFRFLLFILLSLFVPTNAGAAPGIYQQLQWPFYDPDGGDACLPVSSGSTNQSLYFLGDSLTEGMRGAGLEQKVQAAGAQIANINAKVGISLDAALKGKAINNDENNVSKATAIVVALGTNDGSNTSEASFSPKVKEMIENIKKVNSNTQIYWMNAYNDADHSAYKGVNDAIASQSKSSGFSIIDWHSEAQSNTAKYGPFDSALHVHPAKYDALADFVISNIKSISSGGTFTAQCCSSGGFTSPIGSDNEKTVINFLISKGLSSIAIAAIAGNLKQESGFTPTAANPGGYYGLAQWDPFAGGRLEGLKKFASADPQNRPYTDLTMQLDYMWAELTGAIPDHAYRSTLDKISSSNIVVGSHGSLPDPNDAVYIFVKEYEGAVDSGQKYGVQDYDSRLKFAIEILSNYGSNASGSSGSVTCSSGSGQNNPSIGGFSLPVDKKFYDQNPGWFTKPHHDYPAADIPVPDGTPAYAAASGTVRIIDDSLCGRGVVIDAGSGIEFVYCHSSDSGSGNLPKDGDKVSAGQLLLHTDETGHTFGTHLHFGINVNGDKRCPQDFMVGIVKSNVPDIRSLPSSGCIGASI